MAEGRYRAAVPVDRETVHRCAFQQERHDLGFVEDLRHQLAIFQVIGSERRLIFIKAPVDLVHSVPGIVDGFTFAEQRLGDRFQREGREVPEGGFQRLDTVDNQATIGLCKEYAVLKTVLTPLQLTVAAPQNQRDTVTLGMFLQHAQVKLHYVPADQNIRIVLGKPLVKLLQQLRAAVDVLQIKIQRGRIAVRRPEHIDNPLPTAFQANAVQFAMAGGFNIQRHPL